MYNILEELDKKKGSVKNPSLEIIKWIDHSAFAQSGWRKYEELLQLDDYNVFSVGWVMQETRDRLILVPHVARSDGNGMGEMNIVKSCIVKRWKLKDSSSPRKKDYN